MIEARRKRIDHGRSVGGNTRRRREFLLTEQSSVKASLLILFDDIESVKFPKHYFLLFETLSLADDVTALAPCFIHS